LSILAYGIYRARRRIHVDFDYAMQVIAKQTAKRAKNEFDIKFDFSRESVDRVEEILGKIHDTHLEIPLSDDEISRLALRWGAYIGEVMKHVRQGKWQRDSKLAGPGTMPVVFGPGNEAFPRSWAFKRIADGPEDNVVFKFQVFSDPKLRKHMTQPPKPSPQN